jgi:photosystem II stability/assembly factor-like uncharacterized protein
MILFLIKTSENLRMKNAKQAKRRKSMKKLLTMTVTLLMAVTFVFGQSWEVVKKGSYEFFPFDGYYFDMNNGILVGTAGSVWTTNDGGTTLTPVADVPANDNDLAKVEFHDANIGFAAGKAGTIVKTIDGGATWTNVSDATQLADLKGVAVVSDQIVYVSGMDSTVLKTTDGGTTWTRLDEGFNGEDLDGGIAFMDANNGVVMADGTGGNTWYTTDGGATWNYVQIADLFPVGTISTRLFDVNAKDGVFLIAGYHQTTFVSTDGGATYTHTGLFSYGYDQNRAVQVIDANTWYAAGNNGYVVKTTDGGANWLELPINSGNTTDFIHFVDADNGFVYVANGMSVKTTDGGANFEPIYEWPGVSFWGLSLPTDEKIVLTGWGGGELSISEDGGETFSYPSNAATGYPGNVYEAEFVDANTGFVAGGKGFVAKTTDGGASFTTIDNPMAQLANKHINAMRILANGDILAGGSSAIIIKSTDNGDTWTQTTSGDGFSGIVYDMFEVGAGLIVASASSGQIAYSTDGGDNWTLARDYGSMAMRAVESRNGVLLIVSSGGGVYRSTNFDELDSLELVYTQAEGNDLYDLEFITDNLVYSVGRNGAMIKSEDAGLTWTEETPLTDKTLQKCRYANNKLWAIGQNGHILVNDMTPPDPITGLYINEILAGNDGVVTDEYGDADDYIEIYNANDFPVNLGGLYISDKLDNPTKWQIPATAPDTTTIAAGGYLIIWADGQPGQGVLHVDFSLSKGGEAVALVQDIAGTLNWVDSVSFGEQTDDIAYGRLPDAGPTWDFMPPTPWEPNHTFPVNITFQVNMSYWTDLGKFAPGTDFVDVAGSFNGWGGTPINLEDTNGDTIYEVIVDGFIPDEEIEFKFRINGSWDDATCEFPSGGPNRFMVIPHADAVYYAWYNDEEAPSSINDLVPMSFALHQNFPNPFNPTTTIRFDLPEFSPVNISVFNIKGEKVAELLNSNLMPAGYHSVIWNGTDNQGASVSSGIYFYNITTSKNHATHRMIYLK